MEFGQYIEKFAFLHDVCRSTVLPIERVARLLQLFSQKDALAIFRCIKNIVVSDKYTLLSNIETIAQHINIPKKTVAAHVHYHTETVCAITTPGTYDPWMYYTAT